MLREIENVGNKLCKGISVIVEWREKGIKRDHVFC